jgi:hypothetical protein
MKNSSAKHEDTQGWPSLQEQLSAAKVIPGSALEKLIKDNQDFTMLDPSENPNDIWRLPLWLRVYFRKQHPEVEFRGPGVGYPLALKELHEWMLHNQDLPTYRGQTTPR